MWLWLWLLLLLLLFWPRWPTLCPPLVLPLSSCFPVAPFLAWQREDVTPPSAIKGSNARKHLHRRKPCVALSGFSRCVRVVFLPSSFCPLSSSSCPPLVFLLPCCCPTVYVASRAGSGAAAAHNNSSCRLSRLGSSWYSSLSGAEHPAMAPAPKRTLQPHRPSSKAHTGHTSGKHCTAACSQRPSYT